MLVACAPAFVHPVLSNQLKGIDDVPRRQALAFIASNSRRIYSTALIVAGVLGFGLMGMSDSVHEFSDGWLIASMILWVAMLGVLHAVQIPAERAWADGDDSAEQRATMGGAILTLMLLVMLYLMVFQPGG